MSVVGCAGLSAEMSLKAFKASVHSRNKLKGSSSHSRSSSSYLSVSALSFPWAFVMFVFLVAFFPYRETSCWLPRSLTMDG